MKAEISSNDREFLQLYESLSDDSQRFVRILVKIAASDLLSRDEFRFFMKNLIEQASELYYLKNNSK